MLDNDRARSNTAPIIEPLARGLLRLKLTANAVTWIGAVSTTFVSLYFIPRGQFLAAAISYGILASSDLLDGTMARLSNSSGQLGAFLDSTLDRFVDAAVVGAMTYYCVTHNQPTWATASGFIALVTAQITSYIRAKSESLGIDCRIGIAERSERSLIAWIGLLFTGLGYFVINWVLLLLAIASSITVMQRMNHVAKQLS